MSTPAKMSWILPHPVHLVARLAHEGQVVRLPRPERPVVAVGRPRVAARLTYERPGDHSADRVLAGEDLSRDPAGLVELLERNRLLVGRDLEDGVGGRVHDPLAGALVLLAELVDDLGPRGGLVAEHAAPGAVREALDQLEGETVRVRRHGHRGDDAHQLPVAGGRVLALGALEQPARDRRSPGPWAGSPRGLDVPEARGASRLGGRGRRPPSPRCRGCSTLRRRIRARPAARPHQPRPARSRRRAA